MNLQDIHTKSVKNKSSILDSNKCGCFNCCNIFEAKKVKRFTEELDGSSSGVCPTCGSDTVLPDSTVKGITVELLNRLFDEYLA